MTSITRSGDSCVTVTAALWACRQLSSASSNNLCWVRSDCSVSWHSELSQHLPGFFTFLTGIHPNRLVKGSQRNWLGLEAVQAHRTKCSGLLLIVWLQWTLKTTDCKRKTSCYEDSSHPLFLYPLKKRVALIFLQTREETKAITKLIAGPEEWRAGIAKACGT